MSGTSCGTPVHINAKIIRMNHRECAHEDWDATVAIDIFELLKQLEKQGWLFDFKLNGVSYSPATNFEAI